MATTSSTKRIGGKLSTQINPAADTAAREKLITARIALLLSAPFFGNLATRLKLVNADDWLSTAATDGRSFYYNTEFVNGLSAGELQFLFGHEVLHNVYDHIGRTGDFRDWRLFNCAADFCVNADLIDQKIGTQIDPCLYDKKYNGWSAEEVYDDLYKNAEKIDLADLVSKMLDEHMEDESQGSGSDQDGDGDEDGSSEKKKISLTEEEKKQLRDEIRQAVLQAAQSAGSGNIPSGVKRLINELTKPVVNWRELLQQQIQSTIKDDFSWLKPNRRGWHMDAVMPGMKPGTQIDVCIAIDTSGSIGENDIKAFLSEIRGIMESYDEYTIQVWSFDTDIYNHQTFSSDNMERIETYQPMGGGGTDFIVNWKYMKENNIEPKKFIMFTDGMPYSSWGDPDYCDTVFIIKGNENAEPPFGVWAIYEREKESA
jgi:predicted metal-dependent peptidase